MGTAVGRVARVRTVRGVGADGGTWTVRVVWQPRWRALARRFGGWRRRRREDGLDLGGADVPTTGGGHHGGAGPDGLADDILAAIAVIVAMIVVGLLFWWVLLPLLLLAVDALVVIVLLAVAIPARVLLGRPWTVAAVTHNGNGRRQLVEIPIVGWRNALQARDRLAEQLRQGLHPDALAYLHRPQ